MTKTLNENSIAAYACNTHNGLTRNYNEDRISIIHDLQNPNVKFSKSQQRISFFAVYDGHGGKGCAEFLRDHLHNYIASSAHFPTSIELAIRDGCAQAEDKFQEQNRDGVVRDRSGSCAILCIITDGKVTVANVGDSRAILTSKSGAVN